MKSVKAKKHLGQHFLKDVNIASKIVGSLNPATTSVLEIGPGMGVLTRFLVEKPLKLKVVEIDRESVNYLNTQYPSLEVIEADFLKLNLGKIFSEPFSVIGNFPYNISSQILFKVLEYRDSIPEVVGMVQREVGRRIASGPGNKEYGILSVLLQAFYEIEYLFTVPETVFNPPPKVKSGVIRLRRNLRRQLSCDEKLFSHIVKQAFQMRRKTLRNALKSLNLPEEIALKSVLDKRAEQLSVEEFIGLTREIQSFR